MEESGAIDILRKSFNILMDDPGIIVLYALPAIVGMAMALHMGLRFGFSAMSGSFMGPSMIPSFLEMTSLILIYAIIGMIVSVIVMAGAILKVDASNNNTSIDLGEALSRGIGYFVPLVLSNIIVMLIVMFGFILLIIPGLYFALKTALFAPACVLETKNIGCIRRSWDLTKGRVWKIVAIILIIVIASILLSFIPIIGSLLVALIISPIQIISMTLIYLEAREAETGSGLVMPQLE
ncbi:MAG: hypothetical protein SVM80_11350 [Halobacteriota archaeon]|nr:hypothetical protein [Halobacteriota archaeon]